MDNATEVLELLCERHRAISDSEGFLVCDLRRMPRARNKHGLRLGCSSPPSNVHSEAELTEMGVEVVGTDHKVFSALEEGCQVVRTERFG